MTSVLRPVGPEDPSVYWKRRAIVVGGVLVVLVLLWVLLSGGGSDDPANAGGQEPGASPSPSATQESPGPSESPSASPSGTESPSASASGAAAAATACPDASIGVTVQTDATTYAAGVSPKITLSIANIGTTDCLRDIGADANELIIESGGQHAWSSDDCDASTGSSPTVLPAGQAATTTLTWSRALSTPGCTTSGAPAQPGTYAVTGRNGEVRSEPVRFTLQ